MIYELHVGGARGPGQEGPGTLKDAIELLDYLVELGVNAVELLPMSQFSGEENWGYGTSHYYAIEYSGGGRDQYKYLHQGVPSPRDRGHLRRGLQPLHAQRRAGRVGI